MLDTPLHNGPEIVALLKRQLERPLAKSNCAGARLPLGPPTIDKTLGGGLALPGLHEIMGGGAPAIAAMLASQVGGVTAWILGRGCVRRPYPCGIEIARISPKNLLFITPHRGDALWALEQALKSGVLRAVIAEAAIAPDFTESRRLQLAAVAGGALGLLLTPDSAHHSSAAETRWRATPIPRSNPNGFPRYRLELLKNKKGSLTYWEVDWHGSSHCFHLASPSGDRSHPAPRARMAE